MADAEVCIAEAGADARIVLATLDRAVREHRRVGGDAPFVADQSQPA